MTLYGDTAPEAMGRTRGLFGQAEALREPELARRAAHDFLRAAGVHVVDSLEAQGLTLDDIEAMDPDTLLERAAEAVQQVQVFRDTLDPRAQEIVNTLAWQELTATDLHQ